MPTYQIPAPDGKTYRIEGPPGATQDQIKAEVLRQFPQAAGGGIPAKRRETLGESAVAVLREKVAPIAGFVRGVGEVTSDPLAKGLDWFGHKIGLDLGLAPAVEQNKRQYEQVFGGSTGGDVGRFAGNVFGTAPIGGVVAAPLKAVARVAPRVAPALAPAITALETGGMRTGLAPATKAARAANMMLRAGGGAVTGGATAAMMDQPVSEGAAIGAAVPLAAQPAAKWVAGKLGGAWDFLVKKAGDVKARQLILDTLGPDAERAMSALMNAPEGVSAPQALIDAGLDADKFMALAKQVATTDLNSFYRQLAEQQAAARMTTAAQMAGGPTQIAAREARLGAKQALTDVTTPMREEALAAANEGAAALQAQRAAAAPFRGVGVAPPSAESVSAQGFTPLDASSVAQRLESALSATAGVGPTQRVVKGLSRDLTALGANNNGVVSAEKLYNFRKNLNEVIADRLKIADPKASSETTARIAAQLRPAIDDAIEAAGGTGWRDYLKTFETGAREIERMGLSAKAMQWLAKSPSKFLDLIEGNDTETVRKIFKSGDENIANMMGVEVGPSRMSAMQQMARELNRDIRLGELAAAGKGGLERILRNNRTLRVNLLNRAATLFNESRDLMEAEVKDQTMQALDRAMRSGKDLRKAIESLPAAEQFKVLSIFYRMDTTPAVAGRAAVVNALAPERSNQNSMTVDPEAYGVPPAQLYTQPY
jgi:hypothetical protein